MTDKIIRIPVTPAQAEEFKSFREELEREYTSQVCFRVGNKTLEIVKQEARRLSYKNKRDVSYTDLLRSVIESKFSPNLESRSDLESRTGTLFEELRKNLREHPSLRDCLIDRVATPNWGPHIRFKEDSDEDHNDLVNKFRLLEESGLVKNLHKKHLIAYRLTEEFVRQLVDI